MDHGGNVTVRDRFKIGKKKGETKAMSTLSDRDAIGDADGFHYIHHLFAKSHPALCQHIASY